MKYIFIPLGVAVLARIIADKLLPPQPERQSFIFVLIALYLGYQYKYLKLYVKSDNLSIPELTAKQKEEDFKFLTSYVRDCYPYGSAVEKYKGLDNILGLEEQYIKRAGSTKNNLGMVYAVCIL